MNIPYIGVTGITRRREVIALLAKLGEVVTNDRYALMIGALVSQKMLLHGEAPKHGARFSYPENVEGLFVEHPNTMNIIHYCARQAPKEHELDLLGALGGRNISGFQFNGAYPEPGALMAFCTEIVEQDGRAAVVLECRLAEIDRCCDYLTSLGEGAVMVSHVSVVTFKGEEQSYSGLGEITQAFGRISALFDRAKAPQPRFCISGTFDDCSVVDVGRKIRELYGADMCISLNAEDQLMDLDDRILLAKTAAYVRNAFGALTNAEQAS